MDNGFLIMLAACASTRTIFRNVVKISAKARVVSSKVALPRLIHIRQDLLDISWRGILAAKEKRIATPP